MRLPVKDRATQPYVSEREIPAIKATLSAWRISRKDKGWRSHIRDIAECSDKDTLAISTAGAAAWYLELLSQIEERVRKEADKCGR